MKNLPEIVFKEIADKITENRAFMTTLLAYNEAEIAVETRQEKDGVVIICYPRNKYSKKAYRLDDVAPTTKGKE